MNRQLSSSLTVFYKRVLPTIWITGFGFGTAVLWLIRDGWEPERPPVAFRLLFLLVWILGSIFMLWHARQLKYVQIQGDALVVSDGSVEELINLSDVAEIKETRFRSPKLIRVLLARTSHWGYEISFFAPVQPFALPFREHRLVAELRRLVAQAQDTRSSSL
jgi:hypothetical protein